MNDLYFMVKNKKGMQGQKLSLHAYIFCYKIKAQALHIIKPQERYTLKHDDIQPGGLMIYA